MHKCLPTAQWKNAGATRTNIGKKVQLLSISVDPKYDTPSVLEQYSQRFENHYEHWKMLTGNPDKVRAIVRNFQQAYEVEVDDRCTKHHAL